MDLNELLKHYDFFFGLEEEIFKEGALHLDGDVLPLEEDEVYSLVQMMGRDFIELIMGEEEERRYPALLATMMSFFEFGLYLRKHLDKESPDESGP